MPRPFHKPANSLTLRYTELETGIHTFLSLYFLNPLDFCVQKPQSTIKQIEITKFGVCHGHSQWHH
jgi:hypothetical protein